MALTLTRRLAIDPPRLKTHEHASAKQATLMFFRR